MPCILSGTEGPCRLAPSWPCTRAQAGSHTCGSGTCAHTLRGAGLQEQRVPQPGAPSHALDDGPTRMLMLEVCQQYGNPSVLCSQPQKPRSGVNDVDLPSRHLPGEVLKGRSAHGASFLLLSATAGTCPPVCFVNRCPNISGRLRCSLSASTACPLAHGTWFWLIFMGLVLGASSGSSWRKESRGSW